MRTYHNLLPVSIVLVAFVVFTWFLKQFSSLGTSIVLGVILGFIFTPILFYLRRKKIPSFIALFIIIVLFFVFSMLFSSLMLSALWSISNNYNIYQTKVLAIIDSIAPLIPFVQYDGLISIQKGIFSYLQNNILSFSKTFLQSFMQFGTQYIIVLFTMVFILLEQRLFHVKIRRYYKGDSKASNKIGKLIFEINVQVSRFLFLKMIISVVTAIIIFIGFNLIGVDFAFVWAILTFLFNFIPTIGSIIITLLSVIFALIQFFPDWTPVFMVLLLTGTTQMIVGNFLDPKIMGDNLNLSPLIIWLFLIYWSWVWGAMGALLAVPLAVSVRIICEYIPSLNTIGLFMGNARLMLKTKSHKDKV